jgi:hypothetical protein
MLCYPLRSVYLDNCPNVVIFSAVASLHTFEQVEAY